MYLHSKFIHLHSKQIQGDKRGWKLRGGGRGLKRRREVDVLVVESGSIVIAQFYDFKMMFLKIFAPVVACPESIPVGANGPHPILGASGSLPDETPGHGGSMIHSRDSDSCMLHNARHVEEIFITRSRQNFGRRIAFRWCSKPLYLLTSSFSDKVQNHIIWF